MALVFARLVQQLFPPRSPPSRGPLAPTAAQRRAGGAVHVLPGCCVAPAAAAAAGWVQKRCHAAAAGAAGRADEGEEDDDDGGAGAAGGLDRPLRVERLLSNLGYGRRKECAALVKRRLVVFAATGKPAKVGEKALAGELLLDGEPLDPPPPLTLLLHKPTGYVVTSPDDENVPDPKVYDLLPFRFGRRRPFLSAVGRLDKETSGLLLMTDDGKLLHSIQSPARGIWKVYVAELAAPLAGPEAAAAARQFAAGTMLLAGDRTPLLPAGLRMLGPTTAEVAICEGRYHQIRRMFGAIGHEVVALHRRSIGALGLDAHELQEGAWRLATAADLAAVTAGPDAPDSLLDQQGQRAGEQRPEAPGAEPAGRQRAEQRREAAAAVAAGGGRGSGGRGQGPVQRQRPAGEAAAGWYAAGSGGSEDFDRWAEEEGEEGEEEAADGIEAQLEDAAAARRYRDSSRWARRRAAVARGVKSLRWQQQRQPEAAGGGGAAVDG